MPTRINHNEVTELKIKHICGLMREWKWRRGETNIELAKQWDLSPEYVTDLATQASRRVLAEISDPANVTVDVAGVLTRIMYDALKSTDPRDRKNAIEAAKTYAMLCGALVKRVERTVKLSDSPPAEDSAMWTEMRAAVREAERQGLIPPDTDGESPKAVH